MPANNFLPYAPSASGLDILSQPAYAASATRTNGVSAGIASRALYNKAQRQASIIAAVVAQFIADNQPDDVIDDGTTATILAQFEAALGNVTRINLTADTTFYVSSTGNDSTGTGAVGAPWATITHAYNYLVNHVNLAGYTATIQVADSGSAYAPAVMTGRPIGNGDVIIRGNPTTPANVVITATSANAFYLVGGASAYIRGFRVTATGANNDIGNGIYVNGAGSVALIENITFGACSTAWMSAASCGQVFVVGDFTGAGNTEAALRSFAGGLIYMTPVVATFTGTPAMGLGFALARVNGNVVVDAATTFSGAVTGSRYQATMGGAISTTTGNINFLPGNSAGSAVTGFYD